MTPLVTENVVVAGLEFTIPAIVAAIAAIVSARRAGRAVDQTKATGNGFAPKTIAALERIEESTSQLADRMDRLESDSTELRRDVGGIRSDLRSVRADLADERTERRDDIRRIEAHVPLQQVYPPPGGNQ